MSEVSENDYPRTKWVDALAFLHTFKVFQDYRPLKIGIHRELAELKNQLDLPFSNKALYYALHVHTRTSWYRKRLQPKKWRYNLQYEKVCKVEEMEKPLDKTS